MQLDPVVDGRSDIQAAFWLDVRVWGVMSSPIGGLRRVVIHGPIGQWVSQDFPIVPDHCADRNIITLTLMK